MSDLWNRFSDSTTFPSFLLHMYTSTQTQTHTHTHTHTHTQTHMHTHACAHTRTHTQTHIAYAHIHAHLTMQGTGKQWLSFHFQASKDKLTWVTIEGKGVPFLTQCLHSAVNELLRRQKRQGIRKPSEHPIKRKPRALPWIKFQTPPTSPRSPTSTASGRARVSSEGRRSSEGQRSSGTGQRSSITSEGSYGSTGGTPPTSPRSPGGDMERSLDRSTEQVCLYRPGHVACTLLNRCTSNPKL